MYLTESGGHLRELEAPTLRIALPKGNRSKTKSARSRDLKRYFNRKVSDQQRKELATLIGPSGRDRERVASGSSSFERPRQAAEAPNLRPRAVAAVGGGRLGTTRVGHTDQVAWGAV